MDYLLQLFSMTAILVSVEPQAVRVDKFFPQVSQSIPPTSSFLSAQNDRGEFEFEDFDFWAEQCSLLSEQQQYTESLAACEQAIALRPRRDNVDLWTARGNALLNLGRYADSITSYRRVVAVSPNNSLAIAFQCAALFQLDRHEDAIDTCEQALSVDGNWGNVSPAFAWYYRGLALRQLGRLETALSSFERAVSVDANNFQALAEQCETLTVLGQSVELLKNCIPPAAVPTNEENSSPSMIERCGALPESDRSSQFIINTGLQATVLCYERALSGNSQDITLWIQQGLALEQLGQFERAATAFAQAIELNSNHAIALVHHCGVLNQLQDYESALEACDRAFQVEGGLETWKAAYGWNQRSVALIGLQRHDEALAAANQAIEIEPRYAPAWNSRGLSLWHLNQGDPVAEINQAIDRYKQAEIGLQETFERSYPDSPMTISRGLILALSNKGRILASSEKYRQATQAYDEALAAHRNAVSRQMSPLDRTILGEIWGNQAAAYLHWNPPAALNSTQEALTLNRDSFVGWYNRGLAFANLNNPECAFDAYSEAGQIDPNNIYVLIGQGLALEQLGFVQEAVTQLERVLSIDANNVLARQHREILVARLWMTSSQEGMQASQSRPVLDVPIEQCRRGLAER